MGKESKIGCRDAVWTEINHLPISESGQFVNSSRMMPHSIIGKLIYDTSNDEKSRNEPFFCGAAVRFPSLGLWDVWKHDVSAAGEQVQSVARIFNNDIHGVLARLTVGKSRRRWLGLLNLAQGHQYGNKIYIEGRRFANVIERVAYVEISAVSVPKERTFSGHVKRNPWTLISFGKLNLLLRDVGLRLHNAGLLKINTDLKRADYREDNQRSYFTPMWLGLGLGFPMALGWLAMLTALWVWCVYHDYFWASLVFVAASLIGAGLIICFFSENVSTVLGNDASATCYSRGEDIRIFPVVVSKLKFGNVERQILAADFVEAAHDAAFDQRPETINRLRVDRADNVFAGGMPHNAVGKVLADVTITASVVRRQEANFVGNGFADKALQSIHIHTLDNAGDDRSFALDRPNNCDLSGSGAARGIVVTALVAMSVMGLPTNVGFVNLNHASELIGLVLTEASADAIAHVEQARMRLHM